LHHKVQKFSSGTGSPGWSRKKGCKTVVVVVVVDTSWLAEDEERDISVASHVTRLSTGDGK